MIDRVNGGVGFAYSSAEEDMQAWLQLKLVKHICRYSPGRRAEGRIIYDCVFSFFLFFFFLSFDSIGPYP